MQRAGLIASGVIALLLLGDARAADHNDGLIDLDVVQSLLEGPIYPTAPAEMDAAYRHPPAAAIPAGQVLLVLHDAQDGGAGGGAIPMMGTVVDNGDPFGEPGDQAVVEMHFVPGSPPADVYPDNSRMDWIVRLAPGGGVTDWEIQFWKPSNSGKEIQYYEVDVVLRDPGGSPVGAVRINVVFHVAAGQDLEFANPTITEPPTAGSVTEVHMGFELNQTGGSVDTGEPVYSMTITTQAIPIPAVRPPWGALLLGVLLLASTLAALRSGRQRDS